MLEIYDAQGNPRDWPWLVANYGPLVIHSPFDADLWAWRVVEIRENKNAQNFVVVTVLNAEGNPVPNKLVPWYFSTAPEQGQCGPPHGVPAPMIPGRYAGPGRTNAGGFIGLGMSWDGQYEPPAIGPYGTWICSTTEPSQVVFGLGWLLGTPYHHLDLWFRWSQGEVASPSPSPPDDEVIAELLAAQVAAHIQAALDLLQGA
jgi:hypothetical protein